MTTEASACASSAVGLIEIQLRRGMQRNEGFLSLQILVLERDLALALARSPSAWRSEAE